MADIISNLMQHAECECELTPAAVQALEHAPFEDDDDLATFCSFLLRRLRLHPSTVASIVTIIESCYDFLHPLTARMIIASSCLVVAKTVDDDRLFLQDAAPVIGLSLRRLVRAELFVCSILFGFSAPSGRRLVCTSYARPLIASYASYAPPCLAVVYGLAATHIQSCTRRKLQRRVPASHVRKTDAKRVTFESMPPPLTRVAVESEDDGSVGGDSPLSVLSDPSDSRRLGRIAAVPAPLATKERTRFHRRFSKVAARMVSSY